MIAERKSALIMLVLLIVLILVYQTGRAIYAVADLEMLPTFEFLYRAGFACGVVWWLRAEAKGSGATKLYCEGLLVVLGWIFIAPYYLVKTRGARGLIPFLILLGTLVVSEVLATIIYVLFTFQF